MQFSYDKERGRGVSADGVFMICLRGEKYGLYVDIHSDGACVGTVWVRKSWRDVLPIDGEAAKASSHVVEWVVDRDLGSIGDGPINLSFQIGSTTLGALLIDFFEAYMQSCGPLPGVRGKPLVKVGCRGNQWQMMESRFGP